MKYIFPNIQADNAIVGEKGSKSFRLKLHTNLRLKSPINNCWYLNCFVRYSTLYIDDFTALTELFNHVDVEYKEFTREVYMFQHCYKFGGAADFNLTVDEDQRDEETRIKEDILHLNQVTKK